MRRRDFFKLAGISALAPSLLKHSDTVPQPEYAHPAPEAEGVFAHIREEIEAVGYDNALILASPNAIDWLIVQTELRRGSAALQPSSTDHDKTELSIFGVPVHRTYMLPEDGFVVFDASNLWWASSDHWLWHQWEENRA